MQTQVGCTTLPIRIVKSNVSSVFLPDEGPTLETLGSTPTFSYFDLYLYSAYAAHYVYFRHNQHFRHIPTDDNPGSIIRHRVKKKTLDTEQLSLWKAQLSLWKLNSYARKNWCTAICSKSFQCDVLKQCSYSRMIVLPNSHVDNNNSVQTQFHYQCRFLPVLL